MPNNYPTTIREALSRASSFLLEANIDEPTHIAEYLLRSYLGYDRTKFVMELHSPIDLDTWLTFQQWLERAKAGEPIQYIVGKQDFYGETFTVSAGVLIPRPETELLIEHLIHAANHYFVEQSLRVIDLGTGSGAIAITLAKLCPKWDVWALELSDNALTIAKQNAHHLGVLDRIHFVQGDMLALTDALKGKQQRPFDIIVSNPPYIPRREIPHLQREVRDHEPHMALDGGEDGLDFYRGLIDQLDFWLAKPGIVAFEIGIGQSEDIVRMLHNKQIHSTEVHYDFQQIDRIVMGFKD